MRIYHGTQYHEHIEKNGFDISKSYAARNNKLGAGDGVYFSYDHFVAQDYSTANANESFHPSVIEELKQSDEIAGFLLENLYHHGTEKAWEFFEDRYGWDSLRETFSGKEYDLNDVQSIADYIRGSKTLEENYSMDESPASLFGGGASYMPFALKEDAVKMGIKTIPSEFGKVIVCELDKDAKIKKVGRVEDANAEAKLAKEEGYDGIEFSNRYSVDSKEELLLFDTSLIQVLELIEDVHTWEETTLDTVRTIFNSIHSGKSSLDEILEDVFHPSLLNNSRKTCEKSLRFTLGVLNKIEVIKGEDNSLEAVISENMFKDTIAKNNHPLVRHLTKEPVYNKTDSVKNNPQESFKHISNPSTGL